MVIAISEGLLGELRRDGVQRYRRTAVAFLAAEFPQIQRQMSADEMRHLIDQTYTRAKARGVGDVHGHLEYLVCSLALGSFFESDPQYRNLLRWAGWCGSDVANHAQVHTGWLLDELDAHLTQTKEDLSDLPRLKMAFTSIHDHDVQPTMTNGVAQVEAIWPRRRASMDDRDLSDLVECCYGIAGQLRLTGPDAVTYLCLAVHFGAWFAQDPLYPWAQRVLDDPAASIKTRRRRLIGGVLRHWRYAGRARA